MQYIVLNKCNYFLKYLLNDSQTEYYKMKYFFGFYCNFFFWCIDPLCPRQGGATSTPTGEKLLVGSLIFSSSLGGVPEGRGGV